MQAKYGTFGIAIAAVLVLSACGGGGDKDPILMNLRSSSQGPDEFAIVPNKPLEMPATMAELPEPTPGGRNVADPTPEADAVVALGGNPARAGSSKADGALLTSAGRFGNSAAIRDELAAEDLEWRRKHDGRLLEKLFNVNVYYKAYSGMSLDQEAELERWRKLGVRTPSAPPSGDAQSLTK